MSCGSLSSSPEEVAVYPHQSFANPPTHRGTYPYLSTPPEDDHWSTWMHEGLGTQHLWPQSKEQELHHLKEVFWANAFPARLLVKKTLSAPPGKPHLPPSPTQPPQKTLHPPFVRGVSEKLKMICTSLNIHPIFTSGCTLKWTLIKVKNCAPEEKKAIVHQVPCKDCHQLYTGESKSTLKVRLAEHKRALSAKE